MTCNLIRRTSSLPGWLAVLVPAWLHAAEPPPRPAPRLYMTPNYGLLIRVPGGYFHCPLPEGWVGTDHGTTLYFNRPTQCDTPAGPRITIDYEHNVAEPPRADGTEGPPRTALELARSECPGHAAYWPGVRLLGAPAAVCRDRNTITSVYAVYDLGTRPPDDDAPSFTLTLRLDTTPARQARDQRALRRLARAISLCTPNWSKPLPARAACPANAHWW